MKKSFGEKLMSVPREVLYLILILCTSVPLIVSQFTPIKVPNQPSDSSVALYSLLMSLDPKKPVLIQSDWTNSTRAESAGQFEALVRILMRRGLKFAILSGADAQAPEVARTVIGKLNEERVKAGQPAYRRWDDWINLGYFPAIDATNRAMASSIHTAFAGRSDAPEGGEKRDVFESPVLQGIQSYNDLGTFIVVTASNTSVTAIGRLSRLKAPMTMMVTGVMGPETYNYFDSRQLKGLCIGLKGVYDLETMMENGVNYPDPGSAKLKVDGAGTFPGFPGQVNFGKGNTYYPTLTIALTLLILAVVAGNVGMFLTRRAKK